MIKLRERTINNPSLKNSRKRKDFKMDQKSLIEPSPVSKKPKGDGKWETARRAMSASKTSCSVIGWLSKAKSSTPVREIPMKVSDVQGSSPTSPVSVSGYSADVSGENTSNSKLSSSVPTMLLSKDGFESTTSSFLANVDSYCAKTQDIGSDPSNPPEFESSGSWFHENIADFAEKSSNKNCLF